MVEGIFDGDFVLSELLIEILVVFNNLPEVDKLIRSLTIYLAFPVVIKLWSMQ